jgi:hypothetical protein
MADPSLCVHHFLQYTPRQCSKCGWDFAANGEPPEPEADATPQPSSDGAVSVTATTAGEAAYQAACAAIREELADEPANLPLTLAMLDKWTPQVLPANDAGQVDFARALLDSAAEAIRKHLATPAPQDASPAQVSGEDVETYFARQIEWSRETFGPALRTGGVIDHIRKELKEIEANPHDLSEWIDVVILAMDGFWRHGGSASDLMPRLLAKQQKNMARTWPDWRTMSENSAIEHDRSGEATLSAQDAPSASLAGWHSIDSAPKDGARFLAAHKHGHQTLLEVIGRRRKFDDGEPDEWECMAVATRCGTANYLSDYVGWMPLPASPEQGEAL